MDDSWNDCLEGRREERSADAVRGGRANERGERESVRECQHRDQPDRASAAEIRNEHHATPIEAVAHRAADEQARDQRHRHRDPDHRECLWLVPERVARPGDRDEEDAVTDERDAHPRPERAEITRAERPQEPDSGQAAGPVERLEAVLHQELGRFGVERRLASICDVGETEIRREVVVRHRLAEEEALAEPEPEALQ